MTTIASTPFPTSVAPDVLNETIVPSTDDDFEATAAVAVLATVAVFAVIFAVAAVLYTQWLLRSAREQNRFNNQKEEEAYSEYGLAHYGTKQSLFAGARLNEADPPALPDLANATPLKAQDLARIADIILHTSTATGATELPFAPDVFPRGPGSAYMVVAANDLQKTLELFFVQYTQVWYSKQGDLYSELLRNWKFPPESAVNAHAVLREVAMALWGARNTHTTHTATTTTPDVGPLQHLALTALTMEGADIDRLLMWEAPVWIPCSETSKRTFEGYATRNDAVASDLDTAGREVLRTRFFGDREAAFGHYQKWARLSALTSMLAQPRPTQPRPLYKSFRNGRDVDIKSYLIWVTPLACTVSLERAQEFLVLDNATDMEHGKRREAFPMLFRIFGCDRALPLSNGQYPVEDVVLLPSLTPFRVDSVRLQSDVTVVDLHMEDIHKYVKAEEMRRFRKDVIEDAWAGENTLDRVARILSESGSDVPTTDIRRATVVSDKAGSVRNIHHPKGEGEAESCRCHECGGLAHGMPASMKRRLDEAGFFDTLRSSVTSVVPKHIWLSGGEPRLEGIYKKRKGARVWERNGLAIQHLGHRWAVVHKTALHIAALMSVDTATADVLPHSIVRWARPLSGSWVEDPSVRATATQPSVLAARPTKNTVTTSPSALPMPFPEVVKPAPFGSIETGEMLPSPTFSLPGGGGGGGGGWGHSGEWGGGHVQGGGGGGGDFVSQPPSFFAPHHQHVAQGGVHGYDGREFSLSV